MKRGTTDLLILKIERHWGREPGWFRSLDRDPQTSLIAAYNVENMEPKQIKKLQGVDKRKLIQQRIAEYANRDRINGR